MLSKPVIKYIQSLKINKFRNLHGAFVAEGAKTVMDMVNSPLRITSIYALPQWIRQNSHLLPALSNRCYEVTDQEMKTISSLTTPQEVLAVVEIPGYSLQPADLSEELVLMLDEIRDPGNLGTIIRTADWFGIRHILCSPGCVDAYNHKVIQATMGSIARVKIYYTSLEHFLQNQNPSLTVFGCLLAGQDVKTAPLKKKGIILLGNESTGISSQLLPYIQVKLTIPAFPATGNLPFTSAESLNVAQACSIVCYAFRIQSG